MYSTAELLQKLDSAFKAITVGDLDEGVLQPVKFDRFIRAMQHRTAIINEARFIKMEAQQVDIDRVGFVGRILSSGSLANGDHRKIDDVNDFAKPQFHTNKLIAKELQAVTGIRDKALRRNIERGNFENTLVDLFGEAAGRDMEEFFILADTDILYSNDDVLSLTNAWAKRAANKIYGDGESKDFDPASADLYPENMFEAMLAAIPKQFLQNRAEWRFYVDWDAENKYRNLLKKRETALGDTAQTTDGSLVYKGIPVKYVPMMERSASIEEGGAGSMAMLQHPDNMVWGVFHEVTIERDRIPKDRRTDFVLTLEGDADYEDENAAVVAFADQSGES